MKYKFISDSHIHSVNSFDGNDSVIMICENASNMGLYSISITDHCDCNDYFEMNVHDMIEKSVIDTARARALYHDRIKIYTGIELGQPAQNESAANEAMNLADYDFVLGSLHNLKDEKDFYYLEYTNDNVDDLLTRYFNELTELVKSDCFDSLAHMTYPLRYIIGNTGIKLDMSHYSEMIDEILKLLVKNHKGLEVNTSGLRQIIGTTLPDESVVRRFRELGGVYVTIGSDAHRWGDIASGIETGLELIASCGFTHFTVYEKRQPILLPIG